MTQSFPFGEPLLPVRHTCSGPTPVFILGAYSSALHAMWRYGPAARDRVQALAIANEPEPFWDGEDQLRLVARHTPPFGELLPTPQNGPSGIALRELYLTPLGLDPTRCWITDVINTYFSTPRQRQACKRAYASSGRLAPEWALPLRPGQITPNADRLAEIKAELKEAAPKWVLTLGDEPLAALGLARLSRHDYGVPTPTTLYGLKTTLIPLTHPRNAGRLGPHSRKWATIHDQWLSDVAPDLRSGFAAAEQVAEAPGDHRDLRLTPSVGALECLMTSVGIWSSIGSSWERSSPQGVLREAPSR